MAYLNKNDLVLIKQGDTSIQARVVDIRWRRFRKSARALARTSLPCVALLIRCPAWFSTFVLTVNR